MHLACQIELGIPDADDGPLSLDYRDPIRLSTAANDGREMDSGVYPDRDATAERVGCDEVAHCDTVSRDRLSHPSD